MTINDRAHRDTQADSFAAQLGVDNVELRAAADAVWSNLNPDRVPYSRALSAAGVALRAAQKARQREDV
jgi:hypothetical protein